MGVLTADEALHYLASVGGNNQPAVMTGGGNIINIQFYTFHGFRPLS